MHLEWGPTGAAQATKPGDIAVVVDVLSFTTTLTVAVELGSEVYPYRWRDESAAVFAAERAAVLAVGRFEAAKLADWGEPPRVSLSPWSIRDAGAEMPPRLVLPSPNGSTVSSRLAASGVPVYGASLLNRSAVARELARARSSGCDDGSTDVLLVAAGERWPDGSLRPAIEDFWGAGAVIAALADGLEADLTPEARSAAGAYEAIAPELGPGLLRCVSGQELADAGFAADVELAAELDSSRCVPLLSGERFVRAPRSRAD